MNPLGATASQQADPRGTVEYQESGAGVPIVFVPGSFSTGASWRHISTPLAQGHRVIATSLSGYGQTQERRQPGGQHIEDEMDVLDAVLARVDAPAHLVAHSFGAYVALHWAVCRSPSLLSLTLLEPTQFHLLASEADGPLKQQVDAMTARYMADWQGGDRQAVRYVIDFYGGAGTFDAYPPALQDKVMGHTPTNILDWQTAYATHVTPHTFASLAVPTLVVCGGASHAAMRRCNQLLVDQLPAARLHMLDGANHFMIATHPADLALLIGGHIRAVA